MTDHEKLVRRLAKPGQDIADEMTGSKAHLLHMILGVSGEAGELLDAIKKHVIYNKPLDFKNIIEELGDLEFYLTGLRDELQLDREIILEQNIEKLNKRYASGQFSDKEAKERADKM
jgi:NTP pyrophosphatase (non-canonical NTP hydrolase)